MFARLQRLPLTTPFKATNTSRLPLFIVKYSSNALSYNRYAVIIGKKVDKRAVYRNRISRLVLSYLQSQDKNMSQGVDFLFIMSAQSLPQIDSLKDSITTFLKKQQLL